MKKTLQNPLLHRREGLRSSVARWQDYRDPTHFFQMFMSRRRFSFLTFPALLVLGLFTCVGLAAPAIAAGTCTSADIVIYGGTPAGVAAAIEAAHLKKKVVLLEPTTHIGGMIANGLTKTDASPREGVYGGIVAAFLERARKHYRSKDPIRIYFESKWAEATMVTLVKAKRATIIYGQRIASVQKSGTAISRISMTSGRDFCGRVFIDASYEGDLMALSGATTRLGRESRSQYGESAAGAQQMKKPALDDGTELTIDPYVRKGDPSSGLIYGVSEYAQRPIGSSDELLMAFNYRLCVTDVASNRIPFKAPADYDASRYEGLARFIEAYESSGIPFHNRYFVGMTVTVKNKLDVNSKRWFSTNFIGIGREYVLGDEATRQKIRDEVRSYTTGLFWFAVSDPRVPADVRAETARFGWCADEFADNDHFPRQIYVRQARRLVGQYVLTQNDILKKKKFPDTIGLGYYTMDQHGMMRSARDGYIVDEVRAGISAGPYEIPYRSMLPRSSEVSNLIVPVALSTSHVAYTSVRVEPTYMVLGQAAGAAAALTPGTNVSAVNVAKLRARLKKDGQILSYGSKK